jgi:DNA polymerase-3 subunit delta
MFFLFTWEEKFLIDQQLNNWKKAFIKKYWANNYYSFWEENFSADEIISLLMWWWLFNEKKFIIIKWIPKDTNIKIPSKEYEKLEKFLLEHLDNINTENVICFVSYKADKRTKLYKFLSKNKNIQVKEYKAFNEKQLITYLTKTFWIDENLAKYIIEKIWTNLYNIHNELEKIFKISPKITKELVDKYTSTNIEQDSFKLLDNLTNKKQAITILHNIQKKQEDFFKILWLLYWNLKNIILIVEEKKLWLSSKEIASKLWIHPFVVWKIYSKYNNEKEFEIFFKKLIDLDYNIKSWKIDINLAFLYLKKNNFI